MHYVRADTRKQLWTSFKMNSNAWTYFLRAKWKRQITLLNKMAKTSKVFAWDPLL